MPKLIRVEIPDSLTPDSYALSENQTSIVARLGYPDSFAIFFFDEELEEGFETFRVESWSYHEAGREYVFVNGETISENITETEEFDFLPTPYKPEQFVEHMGFEELAAATQQEEFLVVPIEKELVEGGEVYYAEELSFGMKNGELLYVEVLHLVTEEE